jgi:nucleoside-diphosphate-sugar epimerase
VTSSRVIITGAAGLVGQNLILRLKAQGFTDLVAIDKHRANSAVLRELHPDTRIIIADLARDDGWQEPLTGAYALVIGHAQIGGLDPEPFTANNIDATNRLIEAARAAEIPYLIHISSAVMNSAAVNVYTESKKAQEAIVLASGIPCAVLRPSLMFGWFDRKNLGWLARFMARTPLFPVPGHGRFLRQPLYAGDFCAVIAACLKERVTGVFDISGLQPIDYVDLVRSVRDALKLETPIVGIPYWLFWGILAAYGKVDKNPPLATYQLEALATPDVFPIIDWPEIFGVPATPLLEVLAETYQHPRYSKVVLET